MSATPFDSLLDAFFSFLFFIYLTFITLFLVVLVITHARQIPGIEPTTLRMLGKLSTTNLHPQALDMFLIYLLHSFFNLFIY